MNKKKGIIIALIVIIVVAVAAKLLIDNKEKKEAEALTAQQLAANAENWPGMGENVPADFYEKKLQEMQSKEIEEVMPKEIAIKKFKHARNIYSADPSLTPEEKALYLKKIEEVYQQSYGDIPPETPEDKKEQEMIRARTVEFKNSVNSLKNNTSLTREQKETELAEMLKKYIAEVDKGMTEEDLKAEMEKLKADKSLSREEKEKKLSGSLGKFVGGNKESK